MRDWFKRFFYALNMWSIGYEFKRAWWFWDCETGRMLRKREGHTQMSGVMWEFDYARELSWAEYVYWQSHVLPFGWAILVAPEQP